MQLIYCDESCHLPNDNIDVMILGAVSCKEKEKNRIFNEIKEIKKKHNLNPYFEIKWTKVSKGKEEFYLELIDYFFNESALSFRGLIAKNKNKLDHEKFQDGDYNTWYYKMFYLLLNPIIYPDDAYRIFIDIKDTHGGPRVRKLNEVLCNHKYDFKREIIKDIRQIHSHESQILQMDDLIIGALSYYHRELYKESNKNSKSKIIDLIKEKSGLSLNNSSSRYEKKFNLFVWMPRGER